jgi:hypothetical protein
MAALGFGACGGARAVEEQVIDPQFNILKNGAMREGA